MKRTFTSLAVVALYVLLGFHLGSYYSHKRGFRLGVDTTLCALQSSFKAPDEREACEPLSRMQRDHAIAIAHDLVWLRAKSD